MSTAGFPAIRTADGTVIVRDPKSGLAASGRSLVEALAELRRLLAHRHAEARRAPPAREGAAA
ncbi:MAG: hypothetical protein M9895_15290 [Aquamicrobium sp.]|uniref:hypothetical protein n=1 Tax=Aquamicrobium sp. TaxID=1872579 RepID=UPI00349E75AC|nr:hypothetical protein [Aquamicrobium sp.]